MNPEELQSKSKEELVDTLQMLNRVEEDTMASMVMIREELLTRLEEEKKDGELIGEYSVTKSKRVTFKTTLEQAQEFGAIKQVPDTTALKKLHDKGVEVPGTSVTVYLSVRRLKQEEMVD